MSNVLMGLTNYLDARGAKLVKGSIAEDDRDGFAVIKTRTGVLEGIAYDSTSDQWKYDERIVCNVGYRS